MAAMSGLRRLARPAVGVPVAAVVLSGLGAGAFALRNDDSGNAGAQQRAEQGQVQVLDDAQVAAAFVGATADGDPVAIVESTDGQVAAAVAENDEYSEWIAGERDGDAIRFANDDLVLQAWEEKDGLRATLTVDGAEESLWLEPTNAANSGGSRGSAGEGSSSSY